MVMAEVLVIFADGIADVAIHDLHMENIVEELEALGADAFDEFDAPGSMVALIIGMGAFAVEEFHAEGDFQLFGEGQDAFQASGAILQTRFVVEAIAVTGETNEAFEAGGGGFFQPLFIYLRKLVMMFKAVKGPGNATDAIHQGKADHGTGEAVLFDGGEIFRIEKVNGGQAHLLDGAAEVVERDLIVAPAADGVMDAAF